MSSSRFKPVRMQGAFLACVTQVGSLDSRNSLSDLIIYELVVPVH